MNLLAIWLLLLQAAAPVLAPDIPNSPGLYYRQSDKNWVHLPKASILQSKLTGAGLFVETGGFTNLGTDVVCEGAKASTRVSDTRPSFYARGIGPSTDVLLIQLTKHKETRTFHKSSGNTTIENKVGAKKADIRKTAITDYSDGTFSVTPETDLKPGEYLLVIGEADSGYDFGIDPKK